MLTINELERAAYISGDTARADILAQALNLELINDMFDGSAIDLDSALSVGSIDQQIDDIQSDTIKNNCPDYELYKEFFFECFQRLGAHYPCPEVTSDYDKSVIFDAISKGDTE